MVRPSGAAALRTAMFALLVGCGHKPPPGPPPMPEARLTGIAGQALLVPPAQTLRVAPELGWTGLPKSAALLAALDSALADTLRERVRNPQWQFFGALL